jgi:hypothetical protein
MDLLCHKLIVKRNINIAIESRIWLKYILKYKGKVEITNKVVKVFPPLLPKLHAVKDSIATTKEISLNVEELFPNIEPKKSIKPQEINSGLSRIYNISSISFM